MQYAFEDYVLDPERRELTRGGKPVAIGPQVFDLLVYLVETVIVSSARTTCWTRSGAGGSSPNSTLTSHINAVRKAIGDNGQEQRLIRTIARKGFRFVGEVREANRPRSDLRAPSCRVDRSARTRSLPDKPSIAVLPFLNLSGDRRAGVFRRRHGRGHHHGIVAHPLAVRHRAQFELHLQGSGRRCEAGRPRAGRALCPGRQRAQGGEPPAHHRAADRCDHRRPSLGGAL